ncbi:hypothetical protein [Taklimakanibacter albus]|uniref:Uncharacterized protein n=1 Tax=Taklimakanibacter albus TaxID=2800327 RepID=A0ACC5RGP0_9HYPH|nr:hypothetical protein [Aestuariivirga sp. YIM B02566]MBK1871568.1 hypothetical protein [Aestuariivirga sp. YIM B02566]
MVDKRTIFIGDEADSYRQVKSIAGTPYTLVADDADSLLVHTHGSATVLNVPLQADVEFPIGTKITVLQYGAGQITWTAIGGVTLRKGLPTLKSLGQYATTWAVKIGLNEWLVSGELAAS